MKKTEIKKEEVFLQVITKVPDCKEQGNLYDDYMMLDIDRDYKETENITNHEIFYRLLDDDEWQINDKVHVKLPAFTLGEIILVRDNGREIVANQRKADKWFVEYKTFKLSELEKAIALSKKVCEEDLNKSLKTLENVKKTRNKKIFKKVK